MLKIKLSVIVKLVNTVHLDGDNGQIDIPAGTEGTIFIDVPINPGYIEFAEFEEWYIDGVELEVVRVEAD